MCIAKFATDRLYRRQSPILQWHSAHMLSRKSRPATARKHHLRNVVS